MDQERPRGPAERATRERCTDVAIDVWIHAAHRGAMAFSQPREPAVQAAAAQPAGASPAPAPAPAQRFQTRVRQPARATPGAAMALALARQIERVWADTRDPGRVFDLLRANGPVSELVVDQVVGRIFTADLADPPGDDLRLARMLLQHGPEPWWSADQVTAMHGRVPARWAPGPGSAGAVLVAASEVSQPSRRVAAPLPVRAFFVPGATCARALVIAGVHGSEQGGIEVVEMLLAELRAMGRRPHDTLIVVPTLFPGYAARREREGATPANRNFPLPGTSLASATDGAGVVRDELQRPVLSENVALMRLVERFRPARICTVHGTQTRGNAGVFCDPHTVSAQARQRARAAHLPDDPATAAAAERALLAEAARRTAADQQLALDMARAIREAGHADAVRGNGLDRTPVCTWPGDMAGGTSLGAWGAQDVCEGGAADRPSIGILTVEVPGNVRSSDLQGSAREARRHELLAFRDAIRDVFLGPGYSSSAPMSGDVAERGLPS